MGLSIYYSGRFNTKASLSNLIEEVKEVTEVFHWEYEIYKKSFPDNADENQSHNGEVYGIMFMPPKCEPVAISFLSNYRMSDYMHLKFYGKADKQPEMDYLYMLSTKTQFAGIAIHKTIIDLFHHLVKRGYFSEFKLIDEGEYWETGDMKILEHKFKQYGAILDSFSLALETIPTSQGETLIDYLDRIAKVVDDRNRKSGRPNE